MGVGILTFAAWALGEGLSAVYHTYAITCAEQSARYAIAVLADELPKVYKPTHKKIVLGLDCGPHFRCCRLLGWLAQELFKMFPPLEEVRVRYCPGRHGKGICDGFFGGTIAYYREGFAKQRLLSEVGDYVGCMVEGAKQDKWSDCVFNNFTPPKILYYWIGYSPLSSSAILTWP